MAKKEQKRYIAVAGWSYGDQFGLAGDEIPAELAKHFQWAIDSGEVLVISGDDAQVADSPIVSEVVDNSVLLEVPAESEGE
jgi:hypothetical protein